MQVPLVDVQSVSKEFQRAGSTIRVFDRFSLSIASGEFLSVLGPSGCGKSTLLRVIAGLESPDEGRVLLGGGSTGQPGPSLGMMFQSYDCFPWMTVAENVRLGLAASSLSETEKRDRVNKALGEVGLADCLNARSFELSGGMRQRVALARTLVSRPSVLLMDEPFGAVDAQTRERLQTDLVRLFRRGELSTVVFVTHDLVEAVILGTRLAVLSTAPATVIFDSPTRRAQPVAPSDEELIGKCRKALRQHLREVR